jgi:putative two-component system response regulator
MDHDVQVMNSGVSTIEYFDQGNTCDLILLDVDMPDMTGYDVMSLLKRHPVAKDIPVIFLTGRTSQAEEEKGLVHGAVDYVAKPISAAILMARVQTQLALKDARDRLSDHNRALEERVRERTRELSLTQDVTILSLASLAETRDNETGNHIRRTQSYVRILAHALVDGGNYTDQLDDHTIELLVKSAPLHDIGKVGVPDSVLQKPGKLTAEEFEIIKLHCSHGRTALESAEEMLGTTSFLHHAKDIASYHHEKWDGSGYPEGLEDENIPLSARLMALADVYDALISKRVYKPPFASEQAVAIILEGKGSHFDPVIVDAFVRCLGQFEETAQQYMDTPD